MVQFYFRSYNLALENAGNYFFTTRSHSAGSYTCFKHTQHITPLFLCLSDRDECVTQCTPPPCSQICNNSAGSYSCACAAGYRLGPDLKSCASEAIVTAYILYIYQSSLMRLELGPRPTFPRLLHHSSKDHLRALSMFYR